MKPTIYIHHDAYHTEGSHLSLVNSQHKSEGYPRSDLGFWTFYQWFIERDGTTTQTRPEMDPKVEYKPAHKNSISVCLAGNMDKQDVTPMQELAILRLFGDFATRYGITALNIKEHRDYQKTACPGGRIPKGYFAQLFVTAKMFGLRAFLYSILIKLRDMLK